MTVTFVADVHLDNFPKWGGPERGGLNDRARHVLAALETAVSMAHGGPLVILGDLFNRCQPSPALIYHTQQILADHSEVFAMLGNHDQESGAFGHNALAPLGPVAKVIEAPAVYAAGEQELWFAPFQAGPSVEWLPSVLEMLAGLSDGKRERALCLHMGLSDAHTPYYLDATAGSIAVNKLAVLCRRHDVRAVFAGDWHRHQRWEQKGVTLVQVGALCPPRFPPGYEHGDRGPCVQWYGGGAVDVHEVPGPRFYKLRWSQLKEAAGWEPAPAASPAFVRLVCRVDQQDEARAWVAEVREHPRIGGAELDVDRGLERVKAKKASFEARAASSLDDALAVYVRSMPLPTGANRERVLQHVRRFLGSGR